MKKLYVFYYSTVKTYETKRSIISSIMDTYMDEPYKNSLKPDEEWMIYQPSAFHDLENTNSHPDY